MKTSIPIVYRTHLHITQLSGNRDPEKNNRRPTNYGPPPCHRGPHCSQGPWAPPREPVVYKWHLKQLSRRAFCYWNEGGVHFADDRNCMEVSLLGIVTLCHSGMVCVGIDGWSWMVNGGNIQPLVFGFFLRWFWVLVISFGWLDCKRTRLVGWINVTGLRITTCDFGPWRGKDYIWTVA